MAAEMGFGVLLSVGEFSISLSPAAGPDDRLSALRASLAVARALPCTPDELCVRGWPATFEVMRELRALPNFHTLEVELVSGCVEMPRGGWPLARLPLLLPSSYTKLIVRTTDLWPEEVDALVFNAPTDRTAARPLTIALHGHSVGQVEEYNAELRRRGTYPHVTVVKG